MELKRLLDRANVLLLQGAYQGAESFIEQAMAEADKLKQELAEIDTLRTRVTEMAAEVERLQSVIDEANAQEPVGSADQRFEQGSADPYEHTICKFKAALVPAGTKLYASPIPAQQSPAVAVPENAVAKVVKVTQSKPYHDVECYSWKYEIKVLDHCYKPCPVKEGDLLYLKPSPRITEQDALAESLAIKNIMVPYSSDQIDALVNSQIYGHPYGIISGEIDYIQKWLIDNGHQNVNWRHEKLDDSNDQHILRIM